MKQKLAIARALLHRPEVVFLDEPTVGLDPEATREVRLLVKDLAAERTTIVLCTHHLDEVERVCSRAAFVAGRLLAVHAVGHPRGRERVRIELSTAPCPSALAALRRLPSLREVEVAGRALVLELEGTGEETAAVVAALVAAGEGVRAVLPARDPLEEVWVSLLARARAAGFAP